MRFGRPFAAATCQPSGAPVFGALSPPTLVAMPEWNCLCSLPGHTIRRSPRRRWPRVRAARRRGCPDRRRSRSQPGRPDASACRGRRRTSSPCRGRRRSGRRWSRPACPSQFVVVSSQLVVSTIWRHRSRRACSCRCPAPAASRSRRRRRSATCPTSSPPSFEMLMVAPGYSSITSSELSGLVSVKRRRRRRPRSGCRSCRRCAARRCPEGRPRPCGPWPLRRRRAAACGSRSGYRRPQLRLTAAVGVLHVVAAVVAGDQVDARLGRQQDRAVLVRVRRVALRVDRLVVPQCRPATPAGRRRPGCTARSPRTRTGRPSADRGSGSARSPPCRTSGGVGTPLASCCVGSTLIHWL